MKPDNVFIVERSTNPEFVKVLDFGVAKLRGDPLQTDEKLTSTGMIIGTAPYMAPEQWQARPDIDGRADVYALGVMMFEMLCGQRPYSASTAYEWIMLHMEATPPDPTQYGVPPQLARVVRRMLSRQPELRPQSMRAVIQDLRTACRGLRGIAAFSGELTATAADPAAANGSAPSAILSAPTALVASSSSAAASQQPQAYSQQPSYQPAYQPPPQAYPPQAYPPQQVVSATPAAAYYPNQPPVAVAPPAQGRGVLLRRIGEVALVVVVGGIYALYNWQEVLSGFRSFFQSLKPPM